MGTAPSCKDTSDEVTKIEESLQGIGVGRGDLFDGGFQENVKVW